MREKKIMGCANLLLAIPMGGLAPHSIRMCVLGCSMLCDSCFWKCIDKSRRQLLD